MGLCTSAFSFLPRGSSYLGVFLIKKYNPQVFVTATWKLHFKEFSDWFNIILYLAVSLTPVCVCLCSGLSQRWNSLDGVLPPWWSGYLETACINNWVWDKWVSVCVCVFGCPGSCGVAKHLRVWQQNSLFFFFCRELIKQTILDLH